MEIGEPARPKGAAAARIPLRPRASSFLFRSRVAGFCVSARSSMHLLDSYNFTVGLLLERLSLHPHPRLHPSPYPSLPLRPGLSPVRVLFYIKIRALKTRRYTKSTPAPAAPPPPTAGSFFPCLRDLDARSPCAGVRRSLDGRSSSFFFSAVFFLFFDSSFRQIPLSRCCGNVRPIIGEFGAGFGFSKIVS